MLDIHSASPRRYFFEVLQHFTGKEAQRERLAHFASAEGREDLALYNRNEGAHPWPGQYLLESSAYLSIHCLPVSTSRFTFEQAVMTGPGIVC